jgi:hypothetical protein
MYQNKNYFFHRYHLCNILILHRVLENASLYVLKVVTVWCPEQTETYSTTL